MESDSFIKILTKKPRIISKAQQLQCLKVAECIREFKLPQTFPSMIKHKQLINKNIEIKETATSASSLSSINSKNFDKSTDTNLSPKIRKLKLKSLDGRHLGEFDVQILSQNAINNQIVALSMNQSLKINGTMLNKIQNSDESESDMGIVGATPSYLSNSNSSLKLKNELECTPTNSNINQDQLQATNNFCNNDKMSMGQLKNNWDYVELDSKQKIELQTAMSTSNIKKSFHNNSMKISPIKITAMHNLLRKKSPTCKIIQHTPVKTENLTNCEDNVYTEPVIDITADDGTIRTFKMKRSSDISLMAPFIKEKKSINLMDSDSSLMNVENLNENNCNLIRDYVKVLSSNHITSKVKNEKKCNGKKNIVTARKSYPLRNSHGTVNLVRKKRKNPNIIVKPCDSTHLSNSNGINNNLKVNEEKLTQSINTLNNLSNDLYKDNLSNDNMSNKLSIVGQALSMISDHELRTKALQALADCGIGIEYHVPIKPTPDQMSIKESQSQTCVFGLLDRNNFIRITGETDSLNRLQEIQRHIIIDNTNITNKSIEEIKKVTDELNIILNQHWVNKVNVEQIKEILKVNPLVEKAYNLLESDFKNAKKYDKNGLLSIHRAILSDDVRLVKRQLMVLRSCKQSIDIPTLNDETGLELAIKNRVSAEVVNLLLKSGANPTSRELVHDSALTIAANKSSPFLLQLIKYVSLNSELNNIDSQGLTAVHYCVRNENIDGLMALIHANADINIRDLKSGRTPLFHAFENDHLEIAQELLNHGARANIPNFAGQTIFALFDEARHYSLKDALNKSIK